jgi:hypothetical protein
VAKPRNLGEFTIPPDDPLAPEHAAVAAWVEDAIGSLSEREWYWRDVDLKAHPSGQRLLEGNAEQSRRYLMAAIAQVRHWHERADQIRDEAGSDGARGGPHKIPGFTLTWGRRRQAAAVVSALMRRALPLRKEDLLAILEWCTKGGHHASLLGPFGPIVRAVERYIAKHSVDPELREVLTRFAAELRSSHIKENRRLATTVEQFCAGHAGESIPLAPSEVWTDVVHADLTERGRETRLKWAELLSHALGATSARPSAKWLDTARQLVDAIGGDDVQDALLRWFPLVAQGRTIQSLAAYAGDTRRYGELMDEENATVLRGLLWLVQTLPRPEVLARASTSVALSAYKKVPGVGPRAVKVGNAAVYALAEMKSADAVGQLAMLKVRVKFGTAQKEIEKAFTTAAAALGLPRDEIEEMGVPSYGLEEVGLRRESFGDYRAELIVSGSDAALKWFDAKGKALKSVPAKVKSDHKDELKELQQSLKDIQGMLPAQRDRLDALFLMQKLWPLEEWRQRYCDHPLVGTIARRLIWRVDGTPALFLDGEPTDVEGAALVPARSPQITLWHPIGCAVDGIMAWRRRIEAVGVTQPFKQAHREIYVLTDAERNTGSYSNRFAAHILRQHQFNALCATRGWKNKLRLMVDDSYPPATKELPQWGLRAEFWIEGIGDNYGTDTNDAGVYLRVATDQVRFYRTAAAQNWAHAGGGGYTSAAGGPGPGAVNEPVPLEEIPALVFSEAMRDVDLFVGVASVGNDPTWQDGGPDGRYRDYWRHYSFGELSGTATTRKQVLERLVPRLKIAGRCTFSDRFLVVRGDKRTYKIHLGSGNILMQPNDQYLCIVPDSRARTGQGDLFLPFEGDQTLSIIISKAFLLAEDSKIKDPTITRQIDRV